MPTLKQLNCSIELGSSNVALKEFGSSYGDGEVECFVAVPTVNDIDFSIHLTSERYIAPGIAFYVFIDGEYQCNRSRRGLVVPHHDTPEKLYQVDLRARQKEEKQPGGGFIAHEWTFRSLNQIPQDKNTRINTKFLKNLGDIEVVVLRCKEAPPKIPLSLAPPAEQEYKPSDGYGSRSSRKHGGPPGSPPASSFIGGLGGMFDGPFDDPNDDPFQPSRNRNSARELPLEQQGGFPHNPPPGLHSTEPWYYDPYSLPPMESGPAHSLAPSRRFNPAVSYATPPRFGPLRDQPEDQFQPNYTWQGRMGESTQPPAFGTGYPHEPHQGDYPGYDYTTPPPEANTYRSTTSPSWGAEPASMPWQTYPYGTRLRSTKGKEPALNVPRDHLNSAARPANDYPKQWSGEHQALDPDDSSEMYKPVDPEVWKAWKKANIRTPNRADAASKKSTPNKSTPHKSTPYRSTPHKSTPNKSIAWENPVTANEVDSWDKPTGDNAGAADTWADANQQSNNAAGEWGNDAKAASPDNANAGWDNNENGNAAGDDAKSVSKKTASVAGWGNDAKSVSKKTASVAGWGYDSKPNDATPAWGSDPKANDATPAWGSGPKANNASVDWGNDKKPEEQKTDNVGWGDASKDTAANNAWDNGNQASGDAGAAGVWDTGNQTSGDAGAGGWGQATQQPTANNNSRHSSKRNSSQRFKPIDVKNPERTFQYQQGKHRFDGHDTSRPNVKPYWADWDKKPEPRTATAEGVKTANLHNPYIGPAPPPVHVPKETAKKLGVQYQVGLGKAMHYDHLTAKPDYLDDFRNPYAVFRFKYRSKMFVENVFGVKVKDDGDHLKAKLSGMSKEQLVKALFEMKLENKASACDDDSVATRVKSWANERPTSVVKYAHQSSRHSNSARKIGNDAWANNDATPVVADANTGGWDATPAAPADVDAGGREGGGGWDATPAVPAPADAGGAGGWDTTPAVPANADTGGEGGGWDAVPVAPAEVGKDWNTAPPQDGGANEGWGGNGGADAVKAPGGGGW